MSRQQVDAGSGTPQAGVRVDKWLWAARCFKTRTQATEACDGGHVKVEGSTAKPARVVKIGETIEALTPAGRRVLKVSALGDRRGSVEAARALFEDLTPPPPVDDLPPALRRLLNQPDAQRKGRPTKRDRRELDRIKGW